MQLFNGISLHMEHYVNQKSLYMRQYNIHMHQDEPWILHYDIYVHRIEAYLLQLDQK